MAMTKDFLNYFLEQCGGEVTARPMMGEYLIYYKGKLVGDICDNRVLIKPVNAAKALLPDAEMQPPYTGAKPMILLENIEDTDLLKNYSRQCTMNCRCLNQEKRNRIKCA